MQHHLKAERTDSMSGYLPPPESQGRMIYTNGHRPLHRHQTWTSRPLQLLSAESHLYPCHQSSHCAAHLLSPLNTSSSPFASEITLSTVYLADPLIAYTCLQKRTKLDEISTTRLAASCLEGGEEVIVVDGPRTGEEEEWMPSKAQN